MLFPKLFFEVLLLLEAEFLISYLFLLCHLSRLLTDFQCWFVNEQTLSDLWLILVRGFDRQLRLAYVFGDVLGFAGGLQLLRSLFEFVLWSL